MSIQITEVSHVNITVPNALESAAKHFYGVVLGLREIDKPVESRRRGGAWYHVGNMQLHLSVEETLSSASSSKRHVCYLVGNLKEAEQHLRDAGIEIIPDNLLLPDWHRFFIRDLAGNRIEIAQATIT